MLSTQRKTSRLLGFGALAYSRSDARTMTTCIAVLLLSGAACARGAEAASQTASRGSASAAALQRLPINTTKLHDVNTATFEAPDDFMFANTGRIDSYMGTLTRSADGFTIYFDIGGMAGTYIGLTQRDRFAHFRPHIVNGNAAYTGIERVNGKQRVVTTICDWCWGPVATRPGLAPRQGLELSQPANFWADFTRDEQLVDFMLIVNSYKPKVILLGSNATSQTSGDTVGVFESTIRRFHERGFIVNGVLTKINIKVDTRQYSFGANRMPNVNVGLDASKHPATLMAGLRLQGIGQVVSADEAHKCSGFAPKDCMDKGASIVVSLSSPVFVGRDSVHLDALRRVSLEVSPADSVKMDGFTRTLTRSGYTVFRVSLRRSGNDWMVMDMRIVSQS